VGKTNFASPAASGIPGVILRICCDLSDLATVPRGCSGLHEPVFPK